MKINLEIAWDIFHIRMSNERYNYLSQLTRECENYTNHICTVVICISHYLWLNTNGKKKQCFSAPTSPAKSSQGPAAMVQGLTRNILQAATQKGPSYNKEHCKCLLVIDDVHTDWSKYFRGRKVLNDWDVRIEQVHIKMQCTVAIFLCKKFFCLFSVWFSSHIVSVFRSRRILRLFGIRKVLYTLTVYPLVGYSEPGNISEFLNQTLFWCDNRLATAATTGVVLSSGFYTEGCPD